MNYFVIVLPMDKTGKVNRQIYDASDLETAKQTFHSQCGKYFKNSSLKMASVCVVDEFCNKVEPLSDYWTEKEEQPEPIAE